LIRRVGLPREDFVLYADDTEFSLRLRELGDARIVLERSAVIDDIDVSGLGVTPSPTVFGQRHLVGAPDMRLYYAVRNQVYLEWRALPGRRWEYLCNQVLVSGLLVGVALLTRRPRKVLVLARAMRDGLTGRLGARVPLSS